MTLQGGPSLPRPPPHDCRVSAAARMRHGHWRSTRARISLDLSRPLSLLPRSLSLSISLDRREVSTTLSRGGFNDAEASLSDEPTHVQFDEPGPHFIVFQVG